MYMYTAWFRNPRLPADDQDHEWPACFLVDALDGVRAQRWGDHLAVRWADRHGELFVGSKAEPVAQPVSNEIQRLPVVPDGHEATDQEIGW